MKAINIFLITGILICTTAMISCSSSSRVKAENAMDSSKVRDMINAQQFIFIPRYVNAAGVRNRDLSYGFQISISKDTIVSYLPYFGRGYIAPISPSDVDYDFTSTKFTTTTTQARRGWDVSIKPKDQRYLTELYFRIFDNATGSLTVTSNDRSVISYNGYITERKLPKNSK